MIRESIPLSFGAREEAKRAELHEAETDLAAGHKALGTHGHLAVTWSLFRYAAARVNRLRRELADIEGATP